MKQSIIVTLIVIVAVITIGVVLINADNNSESTNTAGDTVNNLEISPEDTKIFSKEEIAQHNTSDDCWTYIENNVYDISEYVSRHPGGDEILRACGKDGNSLFNQRTTTDGEKVGSGTPHSSNAHSLLEQFKIGSLAQ